MPTVDTIGNDIIIIHYYLESPSNLPTLLWPLLCLVKKELIWYGMVWRGLIGAYSVPYNEDYSGTATKSSRNVTCTLSYYPCLYTFVLPSLLQHHRFYSNVFLCLLEIGKANNHGSKGMKAFPELKLHRACTPACAFHICIIDIHMYAADNLTCVYQCSLQAFLAQWLPMPSTVLFVWCGNKFSPNHAQPLGLRYINGENPLGQSCTWAESTCIMHSG